MFKIIFESSTFEIFFDFIFSVKRFVTSKPISADKSIPSISSRVSWLIFFDFITFVILSYKKVEVFFKPALN